MGSGMTPMDRGYASNGIRGYAGYAVIKIGTRLLTPIEGLVPLNQLRGISGAYPTSGKGLGLGVLSKS